MTRLLQIIEAHVKRIFRYLALIAIPIVFALGLQGHNKPVHAADPETLEVKGRDIQVIDGDTILIAGKVADIAGIDAPELGQQCLRNGDVWDCGMSSAMQLRKYFAMAPFDVRCWPGNQERAGKNDNFPVVECGIGDRDVAAAMIRDGEALPIEGYSHRYDGLSREASNAKIGIHGGNMVPPADWRAGERLEEETGKCLFIADGNGNYLSSMDPRYAKIVQTANTTLCSDEEARAMALSYSTPAP